MKKRKSIPIYHKLLFFIMGMFAVESILLGSSVFGSGILRYMRTNEGNVFHERVVSRKSYLEEEMRVRWSDVGDSVKSINRAAQELLDSGEITLETLDQGSEQSMPLLERASPELITLIRKNKVTGAFLILNTDNLEELHEQGIYKDKPGLYLRDYDPTSAAWNRDKDLMWNCAPAEFIRNQELTLDSVWKPKFEFESMGKYEDYLYEPYQAAIKTEERQRADLTDFGYWGISDCVCSDQKRVITYSVPLILEDGTVYGVLGIDLLEDYVKKQMPYGELVEGGDGAYLLGIEEEEEYTLKNVLFSGKSGSSTEDKKGSTKFYEKNSQLYVEGKSGKICGSIAYLELYNRSSPFYGQKWALAGLVYENQLFQFSNYAMIMFLGMFIITIIVSIAGGIWISRFVSNPIMALARDVQYAKPTEPLSLSKTGIREIDVLAGALERQSDRLNQVMEKFSYVINMADIPLAVFEVNRKDQTVFITEKLFDIFGIKSVAPSALTVDEFWKLLESLEKYKEPKTSAEGDEILYRIPAPEDKKFMVHYIRMMINDNGNNYIGFVENVTEQVLERRRIRYERNHDLLTGLMNRRAFEEKMRSLCAANAKEKLKTAAFVMMDLDELKHVNDTYGHMYGDRYIQQAAKCFARIAPASTVICRLAGDEFCMFFYGYQDKENIRQYLEKLKEELSTTTLLLPDDEKFPIQLSGGVSWYPEAGTTYEQLLKCADLAMYEVKKSGKGAFKEFDMREGNDNE